MIENGTEKDGKGYDENGNIIYELINGNGKVKEYNYYLIFEGEYLNGRRNGKGKEYEQEMRTLSFEGEYLNGKKWNGKGFYINGYIIYELINGNGIVKTYDILGGYLLFEGEYLKGEINGKGKEYGGFTGKLIFEGEYCNGKRNGKGKEYDSFSGKLIFEGEYCNGKKMERVKNMILIMDI